MAYNRKYIGARYVPKFASPIEWSSDYNYEPLMIVLHDGDTYTSAQFVPAGISITNDDYWVKTADYNAQIAQFADDLATLEDTVDSIDGDVTVLEGKFPVSVADGGTGVTSFTANKILKSNAGGNAIAFADSEDIAQYIGNNPVARAIADEDGNDIVDTYATKNEVLSAEVITDYSVVLDLSLQSVTDVTNFTFIRFGKCCILRGDFAITSDFDNVNVIKRLAVFKSGYAPIAPRRAYPDNFKISESNARWKIISVTELWPTSGNCIAVYCTDCEFENRPLAGTYIHYEVMYICE